ncbi:hypothetical protein BDDG_04277 [Blastomyces dermatitidis ATCC 18188]|uniref:Uncharacterized protein n=1 Tax=Ajellomyces dermatitidis (strain ATCC 18188 / CBS 674.68) TaxID=653446 RepID=F2TDM2_AJEDA|nr:hypothetical protein BDDG_04277 [Blastomyces dermatitidis ATCC 18188]
MIEGPFQCKGGRPRRSYLRGDMELRLLLPLSIISTPVTIVILVWSGPRGSCNDLHLQPFQRNLVNSQEKTGNFCNSGSQSDSQISRSLRDSAAPDHCMQRRLKTISPLSDHDHNRDPVLDKCEPEASCSLPGLAGVSDQHLYSLAKLLRSVGCQKQLILMNLKSDGENPLNNDEFRRTIDLNVRASATGGEVVNTLSSPGAKLKPQTPPDALQKGEGRGNRSNLSDNSDFNHFSDCSSDDDDDDEEYQESDDDDHVARRPCKRRKL